MRAGTTSDGERLPTMAYLTGVGYVVNVIDEVNEKKIYAIRTPPLNGRSERGGPVYKSLEMISLALMDEFQFKRITGKNSSFLTL